VAAQGAEQGGAADPRGKIEAAVRREQLEEVAMREVALGRRAPRPPGLEQGVLALPGASGAASMLVADGGMA